MDEVNQSSLQVTCKTRAHPENFGALMDKVNQRPCKSPAKPVHTEKNFGALMDKVNRRPERAPVQQSSGWSCDIGDFCKQESLIEQETRMASLKI